MICFEIPCLPLIAHKLHCVVMDATENNGLALTARLVLDPAPRRRQTQADITHQVRIRAGKRALASAAEPADAKGEATGTDLA